MPITTRAAGFAIAAIAVTTPAPALAGNAVYGGSTSAGAAIVINADKKAKKLRSMVVSWRANCDDGRGFPVAAPLKAVVAEAGFTPGGNELATTRNKKGRFAGIQLATYDLGDASGGLVASTPASSPRRAPPARSTRRSSSSTTRPATPSRPAGRGRCDSRRPDHLAGCSPARPRRTTRSSSASTPSAGRSRTCSSAGRPSTCKPDDIHFTVSESFGNFPLSGGHFGDAFSVSYSPDEGGAGKADYDLVGRVARTRASGTVRVNVTETDPAGAVTVACDSGFVPWEAVSG